MGDMVIGIFDSIFQKSIEVFFEPIKELFKLFLSTPAVIKGFQYVGVLYDKFQVIGAAVLLLIVVWQLFKVKFAFLGFECDSPGRIAGRTIVFGFLTIYADDIIFKVLEIFERLLNVIWEGGYESLKSPREFVEFIFTMIMPNKALSLFSWTAIIFIAIVIKLIFLAKRFTERLAFSTLLVLVSPLAFATGVTQVTKGFLQGWVKLFVGNLVVQLLQTSLFVAIMIYLKTDPEKTNIFTFLFVLALMRVMEKLEDIVRDASMSVGLGRDMTSGLNGIATIMHSGQAVSQGYKAAKAILSK